jgi:hypothetical protein
MTWIEQVVVVEEYQVLPTCGLNAQVRCFRSLQWLTITNEANKKASAPRPEVAVCAPCCMHYYDFDIRVGLVRYRFQGVSEDQSVHAANDDGD